MKIHNLNIKQKLKAMIKTVRFWLICLLPISFLLTEAAKNNKYFAEWYAENIYKYISLFWNNISGIVPFSLAEIIVILLPATVVFGLIFLIVMLIKKAGQRFKIIYKFVVNIICVVCTAIFLFTTNCGINYYRLTFAELNGLTLQASSTEALYELCVILADNASSERENVKENNGVMCLDESDTSTAEKTKNAVNNLSEIYPQLVGGYSTVKSIMLSHYMSYTNITGVFFPFTFEANVNVDVPDYSIPATMCHELIHLRGFMREDEANFLAFLACTNSEFADLRYSGYMLAYIYASNALYSVNYDKYALLSENLSVGVKNDLKNNAEYWQQFETPVAQAASNVNDSYLKSNSQTDGVKSYGRMVDLLISNYHLQNK